MRDLPQEIRIASMSISFVESTSTCTNATPIIVISGAVVTSEGNVHKFKFERGSIIFLSDNGANQPFSKTVCQQLEITLEAYAHGVVKLNTVRCRFDVDETATTTSAELEEE